ncbi:hypothetical protein [Fluviispira vulneris]|uniref:hypothetical protein n=1 Tax=Fluviispira vulneris TaxID=2763012 RepID=UPI0016465747|nr:hypothetical protein [Fluviispira vulneris]
MRRKIIYSIVFFITFINTIFICSSLKADSGHDQPSHEVKKVNGEEVYEPKSDENTLKKMTLPEEKKGEKKEEKKTEKKEMEKKDPHGTMVNTQTNMEKPNEHSSESMKKEANHTKEAMKESEANKKEMNEKEMAKSTKLTNFEEEPFDIYRPKGYIWFAAVFVILLFVIFVFT